MRTNFFQEPGPLTPSFFPSGGEGARRAREADRRPFIVRMRDRRIVGAFHEPGRVAFHRNPFFQHEVRAAVERRSPEKRFMVPMRGRRTVEAFHEPGAKSGSKLPALQTL